MALRFSRVGMIAVGAAFGALAGTTVVHADDCFLRPYSCQSPGDIDPSTNRTYADLSLAYANFAWADFLALNSPAATDGNGNPMPVPSTENGLGYNNGEYISVWQVFAEARDIFLPDGGPPAPFGEPRDLPQACQSAGARGPRLLLDRISKATAIKPSRAVPEAAGRDLGENVLDEHVQALRMGPVIDRNGRYLRFGLNFNKAMYDYIVAYKLFNARGQAAFHGGDPIDAAGPDWPRGVHNGPEGSIFVKSAWKVLGPDDDHGQFFRTQAYIYDEAGGPFGDAPLAEERCSIEAVGLVGFHIVHRTNTAPQWIWSTFEHVRNAPWLSDFTIDRPIEDIYSLFAAGSCQPTPERRPSCTYNEAPPHPWLPENADGASNRKPTQIIRVAPPGQFALAANQAMRDQLRRAFGPTVWENYFLVDVQFPTIVDWDATSGVANVNPAYPDGAPTPSFLANSTLETYIQGFGSSAKTTNGNDVPDGDEMLGLPIDGPRVDPFDPAGTYSVSGGAQRITSSCVSCHSDAAMTTGVSANFVFSLSRAMPSTMQSDEAPR